MIEVRAEGRLNLEVEWRKILHSHSILNYIYSDIATMQIFLMSSQASSLSHTKATIFMLFPDDLKSADQTHSLNQNFH